MEERQDLDAKNMDTRNKRRKSKPKPPSSSKMSSETIAFPDQYDGNDSSADDKSLGQIRIDSTPDEILPPEPEPLLAIKQRVRMSQQSIDCDEEFPDLEAIVGKKKTNEVASLSGRKVNKSRMRRVLDSDDDDE